ncbi:2-amino-4-hydroxy-6-hydroxymethyldihydropteridinepyrophosphokinase [Defluviimonas aquaemixtae]|uniref:2-amino-4-hydroxy-6-hydroxymethyldihydropteridine pyrophosphokinase n=1 Tax=Albidovulum aquaemixtae TaxID=1542388 RepID=A0A2R8B1Z2_9RHOB|nr:2-amino-4-hydroxy-6-hydroxymethyldihydropteridinepyrophosphokinase [Defluviimonas aquaemixtae]
MTHNLVSVQKDRIAAIALGGNLLSTLGFPEQNIIRAMRDVQERIGGIVAVSRLYRTPAFPPGSGPDFVNAALLLDTGLSAPALLSELHAIERDHGRERKERWRARTLDLDLLWLDDTILPDTPTLESWMLLPAERQRTESPDRLILPHPRLQDRAFVLIPLAEIAPFWCHPLTGQTVAEMAAALPEADKAAICPL